MRAGIELAGRYVLDELLGHGSVGEVWRATDMRLQRPVALKLIRDRIDDPKLAAGFGREARIAGALQHPGITIVHDIGEQDGQAFIVMELLHGRDLEAVLKDAPDGLPIGTGVSLAVQAADALQAAHTGSVIHRDLKPANLFLENDGQLKICDFGIAVAADAAGSVIASSYIVGTAAYMSPEQCDGEQVDERSDLYALGCVLYALLTGRPPFAIGNALQVMAQHRKTVPISPRLIRPDIPAELDHLTLKLLAKNPAERPADAAHVAAELRALQGLSLTSGHADTAAGPAASGSSRPESGISPTWPASVPGRSARPRPDPASELRALLEGPRGFRDRDLLGVLTAAGAGLTLPDLEELTDQVELASFEIQAVLRNGTGKIFTTRVADWRAEQTYQLADDTVRAAAAAALGVGLLAGYRDRLHEWARRYQEQGWPASTPSYLLTGYPRMLMDAGEIARLISCVTDPARHDRMFALSGGDGTALLEIAAAQDAVLAQEDPDLGAMARLAVRRRYLTARDALIPVDLPAIWIALDRPDRAENLARSIAAAKEATSGVSQEAPMPSLAAVASDLAAAGFYDQAAEAANSIADPIAQAQALTAVAKAMVAAGLFEQASITAMAAEAAIRLATSPLLDSATADLAIALAAAGLHQRAQDISRSISRPEATARARAGIACATASRDRNVQLTPGDITDLARAGLRDHAETAATAAARTAMRYPRRWQDLTELASTLASVGLRDQSVRAFTAARKAASLVTWGDVPQPRQVRAAVSAALAKAGPGLRAVTDPPSPAESEPGHGTAVVPPADIRRLRAGGGSLKLAERIARTAIQSAGERQDFPALTRIAQQLAQAGYMEQAEEVARRISEPRSQDQALASVTSAIANLAWAQAAAGHGEEAEKIARSISQPDPRDQALTDVAMALSINGRYGAAEKIVRSISRSQLQDQAFAHLAMAMSVDGRYEHAEKIASSIRRHQPQGQALADIALTLCDDRLLPVGRRHEQAEKLARTISDPRARSEALAGIAAALAKAGDHQQARRCAETALTAAASMTDPAQRGITLASLAAALTGSQLQDLAAQAAVTAETTARAITSPGQQAPVLTAVASALAGLPDPANAARYQKRARHLIALAWTREPWELPLRPLSVIAPEILETISRSLA